MPLRAAELEVLYTANTADLAKGEQKAKESAQRVESKPVVQKVTSDVSDAIAGMDRVEASVVSFDAALDQAAQSSRGMSTSLVRDFLESDRAAKKTADEIEGVLTKSYGVSADAARRLALITKGELSNVSAAAKDVAKTDATVKVDADASEALAGMDRVEAAAKQLVSERAVLQLDAEVSRAERSLERARNKVEDLTIRGNAGFEVTADLKRAETALSRAEQQVDRLQKTRATVEVDASTVKAVSELDQLEGKAQEAGKKAGGAGGSSLVSSLDGATRGAGEKVGDVIGSGVEESLISALTAIPVAGGIVLAGVAIGKAITGAIQDGLQQEVGFDRLEALTGISPASALRIGRAAGEAYANVFGDSIEANLDTARLALQFDIIDDKSTTAQAKRVVEGLSGISSALEEDVRPTATAVTTLLKTGLASSAQQAFDILAVGQREGVNRGEDLLDTFTEYPVVLKRLGLSGAESLGLINQGLEAGARNSDVVADALKEFQIRATDGSKASAAGFERLGLSAEDMTAKIARGGGDARDGLQEVLNKLREIEDPVQRNAAAVELFGTKAEDMGDALFALDLSNAVDQLGQVQGAAQKMFDTISNNDATRIEQAGRNIEVAMDGIKGTLAAGFSQPLADVAKFISENRGPVTQFFLDLVNGALDFGQSLVDGTAAGAEAFGQFISGPAASLVASVAKVQDALGLDGSELGELSREMQDFDSTTKVTAESIRDLGSGAIEDARKKVNEFGEGAVAMGYLNDASLRLASALETVGLDGDGARLSLEGVDLAHLNASASGAALETQIRNAASALESELDAAQRAGEGQDELTARYNTARDALIAQIEQMGIGREAAGALVDQILRTPPSARTEFSSNAPEQQALAQSLAQRIETLPDGSVVIKADTSPASNSIDRLVQLNDGREIVVRVRGDGSVQLPGGRVALPNAKGNLVEFMASGGIPDLTPLSGGATVVSPNTWRVVGDRGDVAEAFIPLDGSPRSIGILAEAIRRMPGIDTSSGGGGGTSVHVDARFEQRDETLQARALGRELRNILSSS